MKINVLELYSGIGGVHFALKNIKDCDFNVVAAIDISQLSNKVYSHNFKRTKVISKCLTSLTAKDIDEYEADMLTMSPPCQPFTVVGKQMDINDARTDSFKHILNLLPSLKKKPAYIFVENVAAFEKSLMRDQLISVLSNLNYTYQEFLLNTLQFGIPNSRLRYYLIAKLLPKQFAFLRKDEISTFFPNDLNTDSLKLTHPSRDLAKKRLDDGNRPLPCSLLEDYQETNIDLSLYLVPDKLLSKFWIMDIVTPKMQSCCCFTRRYGRYVEAAGSVIQTNESSFDFGANKNIIPIEEFHQEVKNLQLRFFTAREISNLLQFPQEFDFPPEITIRQKYQLLGSSVNILIVSKLIQLLLYETQL